MSVIEVKIVKLWREWYVRVTDDDFEPGQKGRVTHWGPWLTETAATYLLRWLKSTGRLK